MLYIDIFLTCHHSILNGILITRQSIIAYRPAILQTINALGPTVNLKSSREQEDVMQEAEEDDI